MENPHPSQRRAASISPHVPQKRKALGLSVRQLVHSISTDGTARRWSGAHQNLTKDRSQASKRGLRSAATLRCSPPYTTPFGCVSAYPQGVKFRIEQKFAASPSQLVDAFCDASYIAAMAALPDLGAPVLEDQQRKGPIVRQRLRYSFHGRLPSAVTRVIDPAKLTWYEQAEIDTKKFSSTFSMVPDHYQRFFTCVGTWTLTADGTYTQRVIEGELKVNSPVPFVGGQVERAIVSGLKTRLSGEPQVYTNWSRERA